MGVGACCEEPGFACLWESISIRGMSVYTQLEREDICRILADYRLGRLLGFEGISAGIENSNFFLDCESGRYVLTIFERMEPASLPYFMSLMQHLSDAGLCCPKVQLRDDGQSLFRFTVDGVPRHGCIVSCLPGRVERCLNSSQLFSAGKALARLHLAGADFPQRRESPSGSAWLLRIAEAVASPLLARYGDKARALLDSELDDLCQVERLQTNLPMGVIHGDFFRDNILFTEDEVSGVIDLYYAHDAAYALDLAIAIHALAGEEEARAIALLRGYASLRVLQHEEWEALPDLLRLGALRFWLSRLYDMFFPREGSMTTTLDPEEFRHKLEFHRHHREFAHRLRTIVEGETYAS